MCVKGCDNLSAALSNYAISEIVVKLQQKPAAWEAWKNSGKVYGYRKLHDDLLDQGETCSASRVARLASVAGIKAQIGYKQRPGSHVGKPSMIVDNKLDRQFDVKVPDNAWATDIF